MRAFVRPDGKEKVTGAGRYTADLDLTAVGPSCSIAILRTPRVRAPSSGG